jgi:putative ABC transport system permease protein
VKIGNVIDYSAKSIRGFRVRTILLLLAMSIGVASVTLLTSLGEGARNYIINEFTEMGSHLLMILPGRAETSGEIPVGLGSTPRDLTLEDALSLYKSSAVAYVAPVILGKASASRGEREREINVMGSSSELSEVRQLQVAQGRFLPAGSSARGLSVCVLGKRVKQELFGNHNALGQWIRLNDRNFRVIGVLAEKGYSVGVDYNDVIIIPVASAQALFNTSALLRILVQAKSRDGIKRAETEMREIIITRHEGEEDVTVIAQDAVLATFDRIFHALTLTVGGIGGISLLVAGILIMNVMLVSVYQRTSEIGLLKALGARKRQILLIFLAESALLSLAGAALGIMFSLLVSGLISQLFSEFPVHVPMWSYLSSTAIALLTGLLFGIAPARRAASLDPVQALNRR